MALYVGNKRYCPTVVINKGGVEPTPIPAINKTGQKVNAGDKVWVNTKTIDGEIVGNLQIQDFMVSEFSTENLINLSIGIPDFNVCTLYCKVVVDTSLDFQVGFASYTGAVSQLFKIAFSNRLKVFSNSTDDVGSGILTDGSYWMKLEQNGDIYSLYYKNDNGSETIDTIHASSNWNTCVTLNEVAFVPNTLNSLCFGRNIDPTYYNQFWKGKADFNNFICYADDNEIWRGLKEADEYKIVKFSNINEYSYTANAKTDMENDETGYVYVNGYGEMQLQKVDGRLDRIIDGE